LADDIVTRLREKYQGQLPICAEAADEIERLRRTGKELLDALTEMADKGMLPKITFRMRDAAKALEQAVRGA